MILVLIYPRKYDEIKFLKEYEQSWNKGKRLSLKYAI